jgi:uncharacterized protein DUF6789
MRGERHGARSPYASATIEQVDDRCADGTPVGALPLDGRQNVHGFNPPEEISMSSAFKGMTAGLVATLVLSGIMILNGMLGLAPQVNLISLLMKLGTLSTPAAWMDHFIVGVVVWGLLFSVYDGIATRPTPLLKGIIFGGFAWVVMLVAFMPLAGAGFLGAKAGASVLIGLLIIHLVYGVVLGATYGLLGVLVPVPLPGSERAKKAAAADAFVIVRDTSVNFNDDLPNSSPSGKTVLIFFGSLAGLIALAVLLMEFRTTLGF